MSAILEIINLSVSLPLATGKLHAVQNISLSVQKGKTHFIVGESGCGKTLSVLAIMGLAPKKAIITGDKINFDGIDLLSVSDRRLRDIRGNRISMIFQEPMTCLNPCYTIGNQVQEVLLHHKKVSKDEARERAIYLLEKVGLTGVERRLNQYPHHLSGGIRQRIMIAMALMCEPDLVIADEPTTALDVTIQAEILNLLAELQDEFRMTLIGITHDLGVVAHIADRVSVVYAGQVVEEGAVREIFKNPIHPYTQGLFGCIPVPGKTKRGEHLGTIPGVVPSLFKNIKGCHFYNRCSYASKRCVEQAIELREIAPGRTYRCVLNP